jgi:hypothetical protein
VALRDNAGQQVITRAEILEVRVADPARRVRRGLMWMAIGAGAGAGIGAAICPHCANEGQAYKFIGPAIAIGASAGALGFLSGSFRTVYKVR